METQPRIRVFVSHATADGAFATQLCGDLVALGVDVWMDSSHSKGGGETAHASRSIAPQEAGTKHGLCRGITR
jgi:hypothetical protein